MKKLLFITILLFSSIILTNCSDEKGKLEFGFNYTSCLGRTGTCPNAGRINHEISDKTGATASCSISDQGGGIYKLIFRVSGVNDSGDSARIYANGLVFTNNTVQVQSTYCTGGVSLYEDVNEYKTDVCSTSTPEAGACQFMVHVTEDHIVEGNFVCNEVPYNGSGDQYYSTVGDASDNNFYFKNCALPDSL